MYCLPQRLKSTFFEENQRLAEWEKISKNVDFSLWGNRATTQSTFFDIFKWDQNHENHTLWDEETSWGLAAVVPNRSDHQSQYGHLDPSYFSPIIIELDPEHHTHVVAIVKGLYSYRRDSSQQHIIPYRRLQNYTILRLLER